MQLSATIVHCMRIACGRSRAVRALPATTPRRRAPMSHSCELRRRRIRHMSNHDGRVRETARF
jgi:hypothetical protein